jgi:hypothetical protein
MSPHNWPATPAVRRTPFSVCLRCFHVARPEVDVDQPRRAHEDYASESISAQNEQGPRAIRFSTLDALCRELKCQPGDLLEWNAKESFASSERRNPEVTD